MDLLKTAQRLHDEGFAVIPSRNKVPMEEGWQNMVGDNRAVPNGNFETGANCVSVVVGYWHTNGYLCALDVDCYNKDISRRVYAELTRLLPSDLPFRIGERPKFAVMVQTPEQYRKITSTVYMDDDEVEHKIEVLGQGQQIVAYGAHDKAPDGHYQWFNGELTRSVPVFDLDDIQAVLHLFEALCEDAGYRRVAAGTLDRSRQDLDPLEVAVANEPLDMDEHQVMDILESYHPEGLPYDQWLEVGAALHHQFRGNQQGYDAWLAWSCLSSKHDPRVMPRKWESFGNYSGRPVTMATVIHRAKVADTEGPALEVTIEPLQDLAAVDVNESTHIEWLVENMVQQGDLFQIFGSPGTGKTFFTLDMVAHIASGTAWNERKVAPAPVLYMAGEGLKGVKRRAIALATDKGLDVSNLYITEMIDFTSKKALTALDKQLRETFNGNLGLIVVDTLARATAGLNENDARDMGGFIRNIDTLRSRHGCAIGFNHHTPKGNNQEGRGSGAIKGAMDVELRLARADNGAIHVSMAKGKDVEEIDDMAFRLVSVALDPAKHTDNFGNQISTAVIEWVDAEDAQPHRPLTPNQGAVMRAFGSVFSDDTLRVTTPPAIIQRHGLNAPADGVMVTDLREEWLRGLVDRDTVDPSTLRQRWSRTMGTLQDRGMLSVYDDICVRNDGA